MDFIDDVFGGENRGEFETAPGFKDMGRLNIVNPDIERIGDDVAGMTGAARAMARTQREKALIESRQIVREQENLTKEQEDRVNILIQNVDRLEMRNIELLTNAAIYLEKSGSRGIEKKSMEAFVKTRGFDPIDFLRYVRFVHSNKSGRKS